MQGGWIQQAHHPPHQQQRAQAAAESALATEQHGVGVCEPLGTNSCRGVISVRTETWSHAYCHSSSAFCCDPFDHSIAAKAACMSTLPGARRAIRVICTHTADPRQRHMRNAPVHNAACQRSSDTAWQNIFTCDLHMRLHGHGLFLSVSPCFWLILADSPCFWLNLAESG
jgi:hypothetical protein